MSDFLNTLPLIESFGLAGVCLAVFIESALFFGFFLPGDTLLFTAGLFASLGRMNLLLLFLGTFICAYLGYQVGYTFGKKIGPIIFSKKDSIFFKQKYVHQTENFFERYGRGAIILARFTPIVRSFAPVLAGVGGMKSREFSKYNAVGALLWSGGLSLAGYILGRTVPNIDKYLLPILALIIFLSFLPPLYHYLKSRKNGVKL